MKKWRDTDYYVTENGDIYKKFGGFYTNNGLTPYDKPTKKWRPEKFKKLKVYPNHQGYLGRTLFVNGKYISKRCHQLVAECYIGPYPSSNHEVDHIDEDKLNNHYTNLQYLTKAENISKAHKKIRKGTK